MLWYWAIYITFFLKFTIVFFSHFLRLSSFQSFLYTKTRVPVIIKSDNIHCVSVRAKRKIMNKRWMRWRFFFRLIKRKSQYGSFFNFRYIASFMNFIDYVFCKGSPVIRVSTPIRAFLTWNNWNLPTVDHNIKYKVCNHLFFFANKMRTQWWIVFNHL